MTTTVTAKGQVTIPKKIRDALHLVPGTQLDFALDSIGQVVLRKATKITSGIPDRFDTVRGKADIHWRTEDLMKLLRSDS